MAAHRDSSSAHEAPCESNAGFVREEEGDLFRASRSTSLAHCVSSDMKMGAGIALLFRKKFGCVEDLIQQKKKVGEVAYLKDGPRYIFYLVTKRWFYDKPTETTLHHSLLKMKSLCRKFGVRKLAMPRIGCGLDGLKWPFVFQLVQETFSGSGMEVTIYTIADKVTPTLNKSQQRFRSFFESCQPQTAPSRELHSKRKTPTYSSEEGSDTPIKRRRTISSCDQKSTHSKEITNLRPRALHNSDNKNSSKTVSGSRTLIPSLEMDENNAKSSKQASSSAFGFEVNHKRKTNALEHNYSDCSKQIGKQNCDTTLEEVSIKSGGWTSDEEVLRENRSNLNQGKNEESTKEVELLSNSEEDRMLCIAAQVFDDDHIALKGEIRSVKIETQVSRSSDLTRRRIIGINEERQSSGQSKYLHISRKTHELSENSDDADEDIRQSGKWCSEEEFLGENRFNLKQERNSESMEEKETSPKLKIKNHSGKSSNSSAQKKKKASKSSRDKERKLQGSKKKHKKKYMDSSESDNDSSKANIKIVERKAVAVDEGQGRYRDSRKAHEKKSDCSYESNRGSFIDGSEQRSTSKEILPACNDYYGDSENEIQEDKFLETTADETTIAPSLLKFDPYNRESVIPKPSTKSDILKKLKSRLGPIAPQNCSVAMETEDNFTGWSEVGEADIELHDDFKISRKSKLGSLKSRLGSFVHDDSEAEIEQEVVCESYETAQETSSIVCKKPSPSGRIAMLARLKKNSCESSPNQDSDVPSVKRRNSHPEQASLNILRKALRPIMTGSMYSDRETSRVSAKSRLSLPK